MSHPSKCPNCGDKLERKALVDSHDRVYDSWFYCGCGYDQRNQTKAMRKRGQLVLNSQEH